MISSFFHTVFYNPLYNALVALVALVPGSDVGVAVVLLTISIRIILLPLSLSAARTQRAIKTIEPKLKEIKEKHKNDKEKEARETLALYRESNINPFASFVTALVQIPVLLALFWVFRYEAFTTVNQAILYGITPIPDTVSLLFLGIVSVSGKSVVLAVLAGITQFIQAKTALNGTMNPSNNSMRGDFQKVLGVQMKYVFPVLIGAISYSSSGAIALYFITTNIAGSIQELYVRKKLDKENAHEKN